MGNNKKYFFGWTNIKWFIIELGKTLSHEKSAFSLKRVQTTFAFMLAQIGMIAFLIINLPTITTPEIISWAVTEFAVAGFYVNQTQKEKKFLNQTETPTEGDDGNNNPDETDPTTNDTKKKKELLL